ncbi:hypothetical protein DL93DRAFT_1477877 [Clavulina sp. PMI_390]|nr:hypothetical protein DL93DRAFT_1477877 [Clavulina sp. PMI_390]
MMVAELKKFKPQAKRNTVHHTYVEIENLPESSSIAFDDFLFLRPPLPEKILAPSDVAIQDELGYICLQEIHQRCLFVKGILVRRYDVADAHPTDVVLGYNLLSLTLTRDRTIGQADQKLSNSLAQLWDALLSDSDVNIRDRATSHCLTLFERYPRCLDIANYHELIGLNSAKCLLQRFKKERREALENQDDKIWIYREGDESVRIIRTLGYHPCASPERLYDIWANQGLVHSIIKERERQFSTCPTANPSPDDSLYARHVRHLVELLRLSHPSLLYTPVEWKLVPDAIDADEVLSPSGIMINQRCLNPGHVHAQEAYINCPTWTKDKGNQDPDVHICDCAAYWLAETALSQVESVNGPSNELGSGAIFRRITGAFPRHFSVETIDVSEEGIASVRITWVLQDSVHDSFVVHVAKATRLPQQGEFGDSPALFGTQPHALGKECPLHV